MSTTVLALPGSLPAAHRPAAAPARSRRRTVPHPRTHVRPRAHARPLRLTRRGRLALTCTAATVLTGALVAVTGALTGASAGTEPAPPPAVHTVLPGQTMSGIAAIWAPAQDWREVAAEIVDLNGLTSMQLLAGQRLTMPDRD
ncbi:LysM peptidoglycan-binding domain-containing protein [Kineococcus sp. SYSU DK003]|uniref:LysM peptidoglycan-binding domain-containing protein n=1 Tax=Kineococcus sp. SYSU DK003 TaxID=3383124 RepID=UPI003D7EEE9B